MKLSLILTINNRTPEVSKAVADSFRLPGNHRLERGRKARESLGAVLLGAGCLGSLLFG